MGGSVADTSFMKVLEEEKVTGVDIDNRIQVNVVWEGGRVRSGLVHPWDAGLGL